MNRKRDDLPQGRIEKERRRGDKPAQARGSAEGEAGEEAPSEKEILVTLVDEAIEAQDDEERVVDAAEPQMEIYEFSIAELTVRTVSNLKALRTNQEISNTIRPQQRLEDRGNQHENQLEPKTQVSILDPVRVERTTTPLIEEVQPSEELETGQDVEVALMEELESEQINETVANMVEPSQAAGQLTGREFFDIDEMDPVFSWGGGSPFGSDRPKFIVHVDNGDVPSLQFLQALLRDTYKEIHGGEPGAETVEFVANEPRIPTVQKNIVTLDLTADEWEPSLQNNSPVIEGQGGDIVPKLRQIAAELYTGELGYFVLNVPADFEHRYRRKGFHRKLVETLADQEVSEEQDEPSSLVEKVRASPVVLAEPRTDDEAVFFEKVSRYFSLTPVTDGTSVSQVEEVQDRVLKKNDWRRVALTERQGNEGDGESNAHYFWKAAIAEGLARKMWEKNDRGYNKFDPFLKEELLFPDDDVIEAERENPDGIEGYPDIYVEGSQQEWVSEGVDAFINSEDDGKIATPLAIEFETGRREGAFNFRKITETLDKYPESGVNICLVVPDRLLFRGRKRATMIRTLVKTWDETNRADAKLFTPTLEGGICTGLRSASSVINEVYGDENDE